jgi:CheY-like chemotaxis protein
MRDPVDLSDLLGTRVLVVEDNDEHRFLLSSHLAKRGCAVTSTCSAEEAMLNYSSLDPRIVFVDVQMPGMSGFEFVEWLRALEGTSPRIVTTSVLDPSDHPLGDAILEKPFSRARVNQILDDYLVILNS